MKTNYSDKCISSRHNHDWNVIDEVWGLGVHERLDMPVLRKARWIGLYAPLYAPELREVWRIYRWGSDEWYAPKLERLNDRVFESGKCLEF